VQEEIDIGDPIVAKRAYAFKVGGKTCQVVGVHQRLGNAVAKLVDFRRAVAEHGRNRAIHVDAALLLKIKNLQDAEGDLGHAMEEVFPLAQLLLSHLSVVRKFGRGHGILLI